jgi:hypothetical protein
MQQIRMETSGALLICVVAPQVRMKNQDTGEVRTDRLTGQPLYQVGVCYAVGRTAEVLRVSVVGEPKGLVVGQAVKVTGLRAIQWEQDNRRGTAYKADAIEPGGPISAATGSGGSAGSGSKAGS